MDRAIELRELFEDGDPGGVNIGVVNMSLGGPTLNAGRDIFDTAVEADTAFAADPQARLQWFYERTPFFDEEYRLYPVGRSLD